MRKMRRGETTRQNKMELHSSLVGEEEGKGERWLKAGGQWRS